MYTYIQCYERFQWLNHPKVVEILSRFLAPPRKGRKGYNKVDMFRWLIYRQLMGCSYRDLESMTSVDYTTFIKFRKRLLAKLWFSRIFNALVSETAGVRKNLFLILDSSFVQSYSKKDEEGAEYSGFKHKIGFKVHQMIDFQTRLPLKQLCTGGSQIRHCVRKAVDPRLTEMLESQSSSGRQGIRCTRFRYTDTPWVERCKGCHSLEAYQPGSTGCQKETNTQRLRLESCLENSYQRTPEQTHRD